MTQSEKNMGFSARLLQGAKDLVWQEDPVTGKDNEGQDTVAISDTQNHRGEQVIVATGIDSKARAHPMTQTLQQVVMNRPTAYSAMQEAISALSEIPMDEATRYRSAFAVLKKTQQRTVEQLTQAIEVHLGVLETEKSRFAGESRTVEDEQVVAGGEQVKALNAEIASNEQQIIKLQQDTDQLVKQIQTEIANRQAQAAALSKATEQKRAKIVQTMRDFELAVQNVKAGLESERHKLQKYLTS